MGADYYVAESENGDRIEDPSEDALFMLIEDLNDADNTFVTIQPDQGDPVWYATVGKLEAGDYEVTYHGGPQEQDVVTGTDIDVIARELTVWMAARFTPGHRGA